MKLSKYSLTIWLLAIWLIGVVACTTPNSAPIDSEPTPAATNIVISTAAAVTTEEAPTPVAPTPTQHLQATAPQLEPTATATPIPPTPSPTVPTATPIPTSDVVAGWLTYVNDYYGYQFSYPPDARIRTLGVTGIPLEDLPENMTSEAYLKQLEETYPDDLCVSLQFDIGFVVFMPGSEKERRYTGPCGVTGVGDYVMTDISETILIDGVSLEASGSQLRGSAGAWRGEFYILDPSDSTRIHYGSMEGTGMTNITEEEFLGIKETLLQIVTSFRQNQ